MNEKTNSVPQNNKNGSAENAQDSYYKHSRKLANSFIFILPLLVIYEIGIALHGSHIKNSADVMVKTPFVFFGRNGSLIFNLMVTIAFFVAIIRLERKGDLNFRIYILMFLESLVYAVFLGPVVVRLVGYLLPYFLAAPLGSEQGIQLILSIGAGVYEEIVFRLFLLAALGFLLGSILRLNKAVVVILSIVIGSALFSGIHYVGSLSDTFTSASFVFRFLAGAILSAIYLFRGLGIAVYTHALYDVMLVLWQKD